MEKLTPLVEVDGERYVAVAPELAGVSRKALGIQVGNLFDRRSDIIAALDLLIGGI